MTLNLIDLRTTSARDANVMSGLASGRLINIMPLIAVNARDFAALPTHEQQNLRILAAARSTRTAVLVGKSAARMHHLWVLPDKNELVELALPSGVCPKLSQVPPACKYRKTVLKQSDYRDLDGIRLTSRLRACTDIARWHGFTDGLIAFDSLLRQGISPISCAKEMKTFGRLNGLRTAFRALEVATAFAESPYESLARALLIDALPNTTITAQFSPIPGYRSDLGLDSWLLIEIDGATKYDGSTYGKPVEDVIRQEREREKVITNRGFRVLRYSPSQLLRTPQEFVEEVSSVLRQGAPSWL